MFETIGMFGWSIILVCIGAWAGKCDFKNSVKRRLVEKDMAAYDSKTGELVIKDESIRYIIEG